MPTNIKFSKLLIAAFVLSVAALILFVAGPFLFGPKSFLKAPVTAAQSPNCPTVNVSGFAWSSNIGWIQMSGTAQDGTAYGVYINPAGGALCGYAWSSNIGWINFDLKNCSSLSFPESPKRTAYLDANNNTIKGWAEAVTGMNRTCGDNPTWDGWIKMSGAASDTSPYGVKVQGSNLSGYAWGGDVMGWIDFSRVSVSATSVKLTCEGNPSACFPGICGADGKCSYVCSSAAGCANGAVCVGGVCTNSCSSNSAICFPGSCGADGKCTNICASKADCLSGQCVNGVCVNPTGKEKSGGGDISSLVKKIVNDAVDGTSIVFDGTDPLINAILTAVHIPVQSSRCQALNLNIAWNPAPALNKEAVFTGSSADSANISKWVWIFKSNIVVSLGTSNIEHTADVKFISANTGFGNKSAVVLGVKYGSETCYASKVLFVGGRTEQ